MTTNTQKWITGLISTAVLVTGGIQVDGQIDPFIDKGAVYEIAVKPDDAGQANKVEIAKDKPEVTLSRWNGEESITVSRAGEFNAMTRDLFSKTGKLERKDGKEAVLIEPLQTDDGVKIDITLNEKPLDEFVSFQIRGWENFDVFRDPGLMAQPIYEDLTSSATGSIDKIITGETTKQTEIFYFRSQKGSEYQFQKKKIAFRLEAPLIIDSNGDIYNPHADFVNGEYKVFLPPNMIYPIRIDPSYVFQVDSGGTLTDGLISYWNLEDGNDLWGSNNFTASVTPAFATGKVGNGAKFNGTTQYLETWAGTTSTLSVSTSTVAFWFNPTSISGNPVIYSKFNTSNQSYYLQRIAAKMRMAYSSSGIGQVNSDVSSSLPLSNWTFIVITFTDKVVNNATTSVYTNTVGTSTAVTSTNPYIFRGESYFCLGCYNGGGGHGNFTSGTIDEFAIWNRVLTQAEINDLYNGGSGQTLIVAPVTGFNPYIRNPKGPKGAGVSRDPNR